MERIGKLKTNILIDVLEREGGTRECSSREKERTDEVALGPVAVWVREGSIKHHIALGMEVILPLRLGNGRKILLLALSSRY